MGFNLGEFFGGSESYRLEKKRIKQENKTARVVSKQDTKQIKYVTRSAAGGESDLDKVIGGVDGIASTLVGGGGAYDITGAEGDFIEETFGSNQNAAIAGVIAVVVVVMLVK